MNATCEEWIWRGIIQSRLRTFLREQDAILVQAISFGAAHVHGFPRGIVGVALAGTWAIGLGILRQKGGGLLAAMIAHIVADATIASIVAFRLP